MGEAMAFTSGWGGLRGASVYDQREQSYNLMGQNLAGNAQKS